MSSWISIVAIFTTAKERLREVHAASPWESKYITRRIDAQSTAPIPATMVDSTSRVPGDFPLDSYRNTDFYRKRATHGGPGGVLLGMQIQEEEEECLTYCLPYCRRHICFEGNCQKLCIVPYEYYRLIMVPLVSKRANQRSHRAWSKMASPNRGGRH